MAAATHRHAAVDEFVAALDQRAACVLRPNAVARVAAWIRQRALDQALIDGADPMSDSQLAARARQLASRSSRRALADGLERLAGAGSTPSRSPVRPARAAVGANASELLALAALLRGPTPMYARGIALLRTLVTDGTGPAYTDRDGRALAKSLQDARLAIDG
ncbi:MAG: hypothetical protein ABSG43_16240 [Solirubrobacteraceae bacterium]|jgi:hypothetical protein